MKDAGSRLALAAGVLAVVCVGAVSAQHQISLSGDLQGKISYCKDCHGVSAQGYNGYYPIPRLAGQQPEYLQNQLRSRTH
jgi:cytochrome c553